MATVNKIEGVPQVLRNLKAKGIQLADGVSKGLKKAGLKLQRESQLKVPVDFGILKNSAFTRATGAGFATVVTVGYTAAYAAYVHENVEMKGRGLPRRPPSKGRYWDPQGRGQAKFLEEPARTFAPTLKKIIQDTAKIT